MTNLYNGTVLMSFNPTDCALIANGEKTVTVRKTKPKIKTPFKCYIYCTLQGSNEFFKHTLNGNIAEWNKGNWGFKKGKVIGEFVCDTIITDRTFGHDPFFNALSCMNDMEIAAYCTEREMYGWHISDLVIYDKPKELSEFYYECNKFDLDKKEVYEAYCTDCGNKFGIAPCKYINKKWCVPITRPPQSWCYVEEIIK